MKILNNILKNFKVAVETFLKIVEKILKFLEKSGGNFMNAF